MRHSCAYTAAQTTTGLLVLDSAARGGRKGASGGVEEQSESRNVGHPTLEAPVMAELLLAALKPALGQMLDRVKNAAPGMIDAFLAWALAALPGTIDQLTAAFRTLYSDIVARLTAWLPTTKPGLLTAVDRLVKVIKTRVIAKM